ncbi:hypothetical protein AB0G02_25200 [Actinosynnema sp. NPDC023658]|uniref:hypothetical protein n=1 Tax=Actinosynnema sp. NPDC023658 TaxID=3155465 RepID=UPI003408E791
MTTITMSGTTTRAVTGEAAKASQVATTAVRFVGHFLAALVGVAFLGRDLEH